MLFPFEKTWVNRNLRRSGTGMGMGTIRQAARLALSRNYLKVKQAIQGALNTIVSTEMGNNNGLVQSIEIVIVTGIGGGTGSGIFLDMCQILREVARPYVIPAKLTGYIVMPDVSLMNVKAASGMEDPIKRNAYAALKELDFWMRVKQHEVPYIMEYGNKDASIAWTEPPFDHCILMSSSNISGTPYKDGYMAVQNTIAENLMHYMAEEDGAEEQYSYRQYEDNLSQVKVTRSYPLYYGYRAIGAFTKRIPKKSILYYEGSLLFKTFVPLRDDSGKLQPDRRMFTDGQNKARAESIIGNGKQMLQDFRTSVSKLPNFCSLDLKDDVKVKSVQSMNPPPHNKWHTWRDQVCAPTALEASNSYLDKAWARFEKFAHTIIMDPAQGPFALEAYLDDKEGLIGAMEEILSNWRNQYHKTRNTAIGQSEEACNASWPTFRKPPVLGKQKALEQYQHSLVSLYTYVNNSEFLEKHIVSLEKLILRVREYLRDGLKPLCASIQFLEKEFNSIEQDDAVLVQDIYNLSTVQQSIDDAFKEANEGEKVTSQFLEKATDISLMSERNVDAKTSGVQFVCRSIGLQEMCRVIQQDLEEVYGKVNNQSLDDIMHANAGEDVAAQQRWMDDLANSALNSALPMFLQDAAFTSDGKAPYSYMSIPQDAKEHVNYLKVSLATHDPGVLPKPSYLKDHIYALTAWDKLPLYRYGRFEELREQYGKDLETQYSYGTHLVRNGDANADFKSDWTLLPSPKPYFLFSGNGIFSEQKQFEKVRDLVKRGMDCGMIEVRKDEPQVKAFVHLLYASGQALMTNEYLEQKTEEIKNTKNPATGMAYSNTEIGKNILDFLHTSRTITLEENEVSPSRLAGVLGLSNEPCDPFDQGIQADLIQLQKAKENFSKLCVVMTEALVYERPDIVWALEKQLPAYEKIYREAEAVIGALQIWEERQEYAESAAEILFYLDDIISLGTSGLKYKTKGQKYDIITQTLLRDDLKDCEATLVQTAAYLSDIPMDNAAKADLTKMMTTKKRELEDSIDDETITLEEINEVIEAASSVRDSLVEEIESLEHENHINPARKDQLEPQIAMGEKMKKFLDQRIKIYKKIAKGLN